MDKKSINLNNLEKFLEKAQSKLNEGVEDIGETNMIKLEEFLSEVRHEKINNEIKTKLEFSSQNKNISEIKIDDDNLFDIEKFRENNHFEKTNQGINLYFESFIKI